MCAIRQLQKRSTDHLLESELRNLKTEFRRIQRQNIYLQNLKELEKFEALAKEKNKNKFWRFINKKKKNKSNDKEVTLTPKNILDHYSSFFNVEYDFLNDDQKNIKRQVDEKFKNYRCPQEFPLFRMVILEEILDELKDSHVQGYDTLTYTLIKNASSEKFKNLLLLFFNSFLKNNSIPSKFNHSIIKPILKNQDKKTNDTNNIRPLSISNCLAQIFEKLILYHSPDLFKAHKNQFGFRKKTSCNHAIFVVKETILRYTQRGSACKIASLDAEKAFDKDWRDGLF
jgi:hypothetical protein